MTVPGNSPKRQAGSSNLPTHTNTTKNRQLLTVDFLFKNCTSCES